MKYELSWIIPAREAKAYLLFYYMIYEKIIKICSFFSQFFIRSFCFSETTLSIIDKGSLRNKFVIMRCKMTQKKTGIVLLNMGGPEKLEDVRPFLYNLFSDRGIIRLGPFFMQKPLAWFIAKKRAPKSMETYAKIGGGSPLTRITFDQGRALEKALQDHGDYTVVSAMRYWHPDSDTALQRLADKGISTIIALALYPHYSCATSGSSIQELKLAIKRSNKPFDLTVIESWPTQPDYIQTLATNIKEAAAAFAPDSPQVVYSAHSLPVSFIEEGDPYVDHIKATIKSIEEITGRPGKLCFQSRSGPVEWLSPSTPDMLHRLAEEGCRNVLMVPISFVSDHVETLYEIDMLYKDQAQELGMRLEASKSLNCDPTFIKGLKALILDNA
jgi:protoporphyrin/coproporphyrin ferrochelatase